MPKLVVVSEKGEVIGSEDKLKCHLGQGILHKAFAVFVFNSQNQLLISRRGEEKMLWPLFWENSCSSYPYLGEDLIVAAEKRLRKELGFTCKLKYVTKFHYQAFYEEVGAENEVCSILMGRYDGQITPNSKEVVEWKWIGLDDLQTEIEKSPEQYAPWLVVGLKKLLPIINRTNK